MPDKPLTVITYAASASLAAIALVYFFNPNHLIDGESSNTSAKERKKTVVGLSNPANDCFINSVLQSLAGLGDLRLYLIRELHRRKLDSLDVYTSLPVVGKDGKPLDEKALKKLLSLQSAEVTKGLKDIIDGLNERPIYKKTISARTFTAVLERAFNTRISRSQQDAQELLQVVAERLSEEYHAGKEARKRFRKRLEESPVLDEAPSSGLGLSMRRPNEHAIVQEALEKEPSRESENGTSELSEEEENGFPLEGQTLSGIECQHCHFIPKTKPISFVMLTLNVPQKSSTTLNECFDAHFKTEYIDDYKCDRCRLEHAVEVYTEQLANSTSESQRYGIQLSIDKLNKAIQEDPETPPEGVTLPPSKYAPARRIARHVQITAFPKVLVIHLSRSIFDPRSWSAKNTAKVTFPEQLPLGTLLHRRNYKLLGVVSHKGTHNSGHYESFRRQHIYAPISTPSTRRESGPYSASPSISAASPGYPRSASLQAETPDIARISLSSATSPIPSILSPPISPQSTRTSSLSNGTALSPKRDIKSRLSTPREADEKAHHLDTIISGRDSTSTYHTLDPLEAVRRRKKKPNDRWWRISDDKVKECKTSDVLAMQKEVYMLFYEIERAES